MLTHSQHQMSNVAWLIKCHPKGNPDKGKPQIGLWWIDLRSSISISRYWCFFDDTFCEKLGYNRKSRNNVVRLTIVKVTQVMLVFKTCCGFVKTGNKFTKYVKQNNSILVCLNRIPRCVPVGRPITTDMSAFLRRTLGSGILCRVNYEMLSGAPG